MSRILAIALLAACLATSCGDDAHSPPVPVSWHVYIEQISDPSLGGWTATATVDGSDVWNGSMSGYNTSEHSIFPVYPGNLVFVSVVCHSSNYDITLYDENFNIVDVAIGPGGGLVVGWR